ncbi:MAG: hypothetical protein AAF413_01760 [Patescibacteria group bacterium]
MFKLTSVNEEAREVIATDMGQIIRDAGQQIGRYPLPRKGQSQMTHQQRLEIDMLWAISGRDVFKPLNPEPNCTPLASYLLDRLHSGEYPGVPSTLENQLGLITATADLAVEALQECTFWFTAIEAVAGKKVPDRKLLNSPVIATAMSFTQTVNVVVRDVVRVGIELGEQVELPQTRAGFLEMFYQAPEYLGERGYKSVVTIKESRAAEQRGRCPGSQIDPTNKESWYRTVASVVIPRYRKDTRHKSKRC